MSDIKLSKATERSSFLVFNYYADGPSLIAIFFNRDKAIRYMKDHEPPLGSYVSEQVIRLSTSHRWGDL